jgi:hypothetical protein
MPLAGRRCDRDVLRVFKRAQRESNGIYVLSYQLLEPTTLADRRVISHRPRKTPSRIRQKSMPRPPHIFATKSWYPPAYIQSIRTPSDPIRPPLPIDLADRHPLHLDKRREWTEPRVRVRTSADARQRDRTVVDHDTNVGRLSVVARSGAREN